MKVVPEEVVVDFAATLCKGSSEILAGMNWLFMCIIMIAVEYATGKRFASNMDNTYIGVGEVDESFGRVGLTYF